MEEDGKKRKVTLIINPRGKGKSKIQIIGKRKGKRENQKQGGYRQLILPFLFEGERDE